MTDTKENKEVQGIKASHGWMMQWLESDLAALIADENSWLSDLASFAKNLTRDNTEKKLTKHNLNLLKKGLQDWWLVDFEAWVRNWKQFWFEVIGNDIEPTLTPTGDCLIPINFRYDSQRRTKLLVIHIKDVNWENEYSIPNWDNKYEIQIWKESWTYSLSQDKTGFHLLINN